MIRFYLNDHHPIIVTPLLIFLTLLECVSNMPMLNKAAGNFTQASSEIVDAVVLTSSIWSGTSLFAFAQQHALLRNLLTQLARDPSSLCSSSIHLLSASHKRIAATSKHLLEYHLAWPEAASKLSQLSNSSMSSGLFSSLSSGGYTELSRFFPAAISDAKRWSTTQRNSFTTQLLRLRC